MAKTGKKSNKKSNKNPDKNQLNLSASKVSKDSKVATVAKDAKEVKVETILAHVRPTPFTQNQYSNNEKIDLISGHFAEIMKVLGLDLRNDSLQETPRRIAKMYVNEIFSGLDQSCFPRMTVIENEMKYDQMVVVKNIQVLSVCEHHFQTIDGLATVAYIPSRKVVGLSKINRVVQFFSRRPQIQERLTNQIADCLQYVLESDHVAVHITAKHYCVIARGVQDSQSSTSTADLRGHFKSKIETRNEFLTHCPTRFDRA